MNKRFIYVVRGESYDKNATYHHYFDVAFCTNSKVAEAIYEKCKSLHEDTRYWINKEELTTMPF